MTENPRVLIFAGDPDCFFYAMEPALAGLEYEVLSDPAKLANTLDRFAPSVCYAISGDGITKPDMHPIARHPSITGSTPERNSAVRNPLPFPSRTR